MARTVDKGVLTPAGGTRLFGDEDGTTGNFQPAALLHAIRGHYSALDPAYAIDNTGVADCTAGFALLDAAAGNSGARVIPAGTYYCATKVTFSGPVLADPGAIFVSDAATIGLDIRRGTGATAIEWSVLALPEVRRGTKTWGSDIGVRLCNIHRCCVSIPRVLNFGVGLLVTSEGTFGSTHNAIDFGHLDNNKVNCRLQPTGTTSWVNENTFAGAGQCSMNSGEGSNISGARHIQIINGATYPCNNNRFIGISLEGSGPEYHVECEGLRNLWLWCRWETFNPGTDLPKIHYSGSVADGNVVWYGYDARWIAYTSDAGASANHHYDETGLRIIGAATGGVLQLEHGTSSNSAVLATLAAGAGLGADASTAYGLQISHTGTRAKATADTDYRWQLAHATGVLTWGDGAGVKDTNLYRNGADILKTDDQFQAALGITVGGGTKVAKILSTAAALNFPSIAAGGSAELTITLTGAAVAATNIASANPTNGAIEAGLSWNAYVSAADTVTVRVVNPTAGAIDPANQNWRVVVLQF